MWIPPQAKQVRGVVMAGMTLMERECVTREYLCDFYRLASNRPRRYEWQVHALGQFQGDPAWKPSEELTDRLYNMSNRAIAWFSE